MEQKIEQSQLPSWAGEEGDWSSVIEGERVLREAQISARVDQLRKAVDDFRKAFDTYMNATVSHPLRALQWGGERLALPCALLTRLSELFTIVEQVHARFRADFPQRSEGPVIQLILYPYYQRIAKFVLLVEHRDPFAEAAKEPCAHTHVPTDEDIEQLGQALESVGLRPRLGFGGAHAGGAGGGAAMPLRHPSLARVAAAPGELEAFGEAAQMRRLRSRSEEGELQPLPKRVAQGAPVASRPKHGRFRPRAAKTNEPMSNMALPAPLERKAGGFPQQSGFLDLSPSQTPLDLGAAASAGLAGEALPQLPIGPFAPAAARSALKRRGDEAEEASAARRTRTHLGGFVPQMPEAPRPRGEVRVRRPSSRAAPPAASPLGWASF